MIKLDYFSGKKVRNIASIWFTLILCNLFDYSSDFYASFLTVLLRQPDVPTSMLVDTELQSLLHDYVGISCQILYEMIIASDRVSLSLLYSTILSMWSSLILHISFRPCGRRWNSKHRQLWICFLLLILMQARLVSYKILLSVLNWTTV